MGTRKHDEVGKPSSDAREKGDVNPLRGHGKHGGGDERKAQHGNTREGGGKRSGDR
jgi:hypothetical protein